MTARQKIDTTTVFDPSTAPAKKDIEKADVDVVARHDPETEPVEQEPYRFTTPLVQTVRVAIALGRPLLLQGDPGSGKTRLAHAVAYHLGLPLERAYVKSTTRAADLLTTFDAVARLYMAQLPVALQTALRAAGFGLASDRALVELCVMLWASTDTDAQSVRAVLARHVPPWDVEENRATAGRPAAHATSVAVPDNGAGFRHRTRCGWSRARLDRCARRPSALVARPAAAGPAVPPPGSSVKLAVDGGGVADVNAHQTRVSYGANRLPGSSGSPCFTFDLKLVALHHASWPCTTPRGPAPRRPVVVRHNEGIPIAAIAAHLRATGAAALLGGH